MKAEDLMVGDWVNVFGTPKQIEGVRKFRNGDEIIYYDGDNGNFIKAVTPILLTKEIMLKNGFNLYPEETNVFYLNAGYRHDLDTVCLYIGDIERPSIYGNDSLGEKTYVVLHCKYVHEFQHVLKMCGINKKIILN